MVNKNIRLGASYIGDGVYINKFLNIPNTWVIFVDNGLDITQEIYVTSDMAVLILQRIKTWDEIEKNDH